MRRVRIMYKDLVPPMAMQTYLCSTEGMAIKLEAGLRKSLNTDKFYILTDDYTQEYKQ